MNRMLQNMACDLLRQALVAAVTPGYRRFIAATRQPAVVQSRKIAAILGRNQACEYGRAHGFAKIKSVEQFQKQVPIIDYEMIRPQIQRLLAGENGILTTEAASRFLVTSGSSSEPKYIPVTSGFEKEYTTRLQFFHIYKDCPQVIRPRAVLTLAGKLRETVSPAGAQCGAASGLMLKRQTWPLNQIFAIPREVFQIDDFAAKYYLMLRHAVAADLRAMVVANPSTILLLSRLLQERAPELIRDLADGTMPAEMARYRAAFKLSPRPEAARRLEKCLTASGRTPDFKQLWPNLCRIVCWRDGSAGLYLDPLIKLFGDVPIHSLGYMASEGLGAIHVPEVNQDVLNLMGHFFEFCEEDRMAAVTGRCETLLQAHELEIGKRYFIIFTTSAGLYRYHINDLIEVRGKFHETPIIHFIQKGGNTHSFTGEKLTETQVLKAVNEVARESELELKFFALVPCFQETPFYTLYLEAPAGIPASIWPDFCQRVDDRLGKINVEYQAKRSSLRLAAMTVHPIRSGFFDYYSREGHRQMRDAQFKIKHLAPGEFFQKLLTAFEASPVGQVT